MGMPSDRRMRQRVVNGFDGGGGIADAVDAIPERFRGVAPPRRTARRSRVAAVLEQRHHLCFDNGNARLATGNGRPDGTIQCSTVQQTPYVLRNLVFLINVVFWKKRFFLTNILYFTALSFIFGAYLPIFKLDLNKYSVIFLYLARFQNTRFLKIRYVQ